jgi:hypothetical protein
MRPWIRLSAILLALAVQVGLAAAATAAAPAATETVAVTFDESRLSTVLGDRITIRARIANSGSTPTDRLIAHLNVASLTGTYVDLEDWTASPTLDVPPLGAGDSTSVSWEVQAVNAGTFGIYVALMPNAASAAVSGPMVASPPLRVHVEGRRTLNPRGALPIVIIIPGMLGLVAAAARYRVRHAS